MYKKYELSQQKKPKLFHFAHEQQIRSQQQDNSYSQDNNQDLQSSAIRNSKQNQIDELTEQQKIDMRRVNRARYQFEGTDSQGQQTEPERKQALKMNLFRQSARQRQRQFHQQNHEYLRMFSVIASSAISMDKFKINSNKQGGQLGRNKDQKNTAKSSQDFAIVHLHLYTQLTSSLISYKFPMKDTYNIVPFKKQSFQFETRQCLDPKYEFFVFQKTSAKIDDVRNNLKNVLEQGLTSEFKGTVIRTIGNLNYFQFLDMINNRKESTIVKYSEYPKQVLQIAHQNEVFELNSDQEEFYTKAQIILQQQQTDQRLVSCQNYDLQQTAPSVYFQVAQQYTIYKKYRQIQFSFLKIYDKDISINTDIRNIISSEKIYLIELVKQLDLYIELSTHSSDIKIMKEIYKQLKRKSQQFLRLLCGYTESKILKQYNIENYHEKIMMFVEKSIKYDKEIEKLDPEVLKEFPILKIWYEIPKMLFGYSREKLHRKYYDLVRAILKYQEWINDADLEKQLTKKRPNVKYPLESL